PRSASIAVSRDGSMVIGHAGERTLLWLDAGGRLIRAVGPRGAGPGEFRSDVDLPPDLRALPDGVVAWDSSLRRLTFYSSTGELLRTARLPSTGRLLGLASATEAVFGGTSSPELRPREYFGVDLESGEVTWRWMGPPARSPVI